MQSVLFDLLFTRGMLILPCCWGIGHLVQISPFVLNRSIPWICAVTGGILGGCIPGLLAHQSLMCAVIQGVCWGWAAVGAHQMAKNLRKQK